jgi:hypothetical protein
MPFYSIEAGYGDGMYGGAVGISAGIADAAWKEK